MKANPEHFQWTIHRVLYFRSHEYTCGFRTGLLYIVDQMIELGVLGE